MTNYSPFLCFRWSGCKKRFQAGNKVLYACITIRLVVNYLLLYNHLNAVLSQNFGPDRDLICILGLLDFTTIYIYIYLRRFRLGRHDNFYRVDANYTLTGN